MKDGIYSYDLEMIVPLGVRKGEIEIRINGDDVGGTLSILGNSHTFSRATCIDERIVFCGNLKTLMYSLAYEASGQLSADAISFEMNTPRGIFKATGVRKMEGID